MSLTLYFAAGSSSLPALVGLEEAGAEFDAVRLVLPDGPAAAGVPGHQSARPAFQRAVAHEASQRTLAAA